MLSYILKRLLYALPIALSVTVVSFMLVYLAPGDPLNAIAPADAPADDAEWYFTLFSSTKGTLSHLKSGTKYVFKVTATSPEANKMNTYNFSNPVEKFVP